MSDTRYMKHLPALTGIVILVAIGVAAVLYGEADDAPGLQLMGGALVLGAAVVGVRAVRRSR